MKLESLKSSKFEPLLKSEMNVIRGGDMVGNSANCTGGGGERVGFPEVGPNGTRYMWRMYSSDNAYGQYNVTYEWGPYYKA